MSDSLYNTGIRPIIDDYLLEESKKVRDYGDYWSASSAGYCMRKVIFDRMQVDKVNPEDPRKQRVFSAGHIFHDWIQGLTKDAKISESQEEELKNDKLMVKGHYDDLILMTFNENGERVVFGDEPRAQHRILYDYKTQNSRAFNYQRGMSHFHRMQLGTYLYMLRQKKVDVSEGRILKISKDDLRLHEDQLIYDERLEKEVVEYWSTINGYWKNKKLPACTCAEFEGGFMANPKYNDYHYNGEPCSLDWYNLWKERKGEILQA